ncbi:B-cell receptor CD22-like isoform X2 [Aquarana catesbeiana]|uniref:B-cell receptor CD22-like isoform X2 n=1 Tax=Aquarana catesbeiana TaxID=8400 RepID=UPI003CCA519D
MSITKKILLFTIFKGLVCQRWEFPTEVVGLIGSCVEIPCTFRPRENSGTSSTVWFLYHENSRKSTSFHPFFERRRHSQIFNSQGSSSTLMDYTDRTSLVLGMNSCSLKIDPVRRDDGGKFYYPGIAEDLETSAWSKQGRMTLQLHVTDTPSIMELTRSAEMVEGRGEIVSCSVEHTCGSNPPSLKWNKPGQTIRQGSEDLSGGKWREVLMNIYIPSHKDDRKQIQCTATYRNGETSQNATRLNIKYAPKDVMISLPKFKEFLEGSDVILTCSCRSNPPPHRYEWYHANSKIKLGLEIRRIVVRNVSKDMEPYSCTAINTVGRGESPPKEIPVQYAATGVQVVVLHPTEGATELKCTFANCRPSVTHYTWMKAGNILIDKTEQILVLDSNEDRFGSYSCIAHNTAGSSTSAEMVFADYNTDKGSTDIKDNSNLFLILGILAGVILLIVIVYFSIRILNNQMPHIRIL